MPEMGGMETTRRIRRIKGAVGSIPIIVMTQMLCRGNGTVTSVRACPNYLSKPVRKNDLLSMVGVLGGGHGVMPSRRSG